MSPWRARISVLAVFLLGFIGGATAMHLYVLRIQDEIFSAPDPIAQIIIRRIDQQCDLSEEQEKQIHAIILETRTEIAHIQQDLLPRMVAIMDRATTRIAQVLNAEQQEIFQRITSEKKARILKDLKK